MTSKSLVWYNHAEIREEAIDTLGVDPAIFLLLDKMTDNQRASVFGAYCRCGSENNACRCWAATDPAAHRRLTDADILQKACLQSWSAGYQTAVETLGDFAGEFGDEQMKAAIAHLVERLLEVKP